MSTRAVSKEQEEEQETLPASETRVGPGSGRWNVAAMPVEKSTQFRASIRRLAMRSTAGSVFRPRPTAGRRCWPTARSTSRTRMA